MYYIVFVGPAGSGKSSLVDAFGAWLEYNELSVARLNLDPAAEYLPYEPDVDIRHYVTAKEMMDKYKLGPNGALVAAVDRVIEFVEELREDIEATRPNYILVDTPGQMELFAFRDSGPEVLRILIGDNRAVAVFLVDAVFASNPSSLASALFLALSTRLRLKLPQITVISKADLLDKNAMEEIDELLENPSRLYERMGVGDPEFTAAVASALEVLLPAEAPGALARYVSAVSGYGLDDLYAVVQQVLAGGEDFYTEEPNPRL